MSESKLQGYLVVKVLEAAGQNGDDDQVWDESVRNVFAKSTCRYCLYDDDEISF